MKLPLFSRMVYGMWRLNDDSDTSDAHIIAKVEACLEQGITTMDHADLVATMNAKRCMGGPCEPTGPAGGDPERHQMWNQTDFR